MGDMNGLLLRFDDVADMVARLGSKGAAEAFIAAQEYFADNYYGDPVDERPKPMTAAEWKDILDDEGKEFWSDEGEEEEEIEEEAEEELLDDENEEEELEDEEEKEEEEEHVAKKAKQS